MRLFIKKAEKEDIKQINKIEKNCFEDGRFKEKDFEYEILENKFANFFVLMNDEDEILGYIDYLITFNSATIVKIAVDPQFQGYGYSKILMDQMFNHFKELGYGVIETVTLEVRNNNSIAFHLYQTYGFKLVTIKKAYYSNGDDAIYMVKGLL